MKSTARRKNPLKLWPLLFVVPLLVFLPGCSLLQRPAEPAVEAEPAAEAAPPVEFSEAAEAESVQSIPEPAPARSSSQIASAPRRPAPQPEPIAAATSTYEAAPSSRPAPDSRPEVVTPPSAPRQGEQPSRSVAELTPEPPPPPLPVFVEVPAGAVLEVRLAEALSTESHESGDYFETILDRDLVVDGEVVVRQGTVVRGRLVESLQSGKVKGRARMELTLNRIETAGEPRTIRTNSIAIEAESTQGRDAKVIGGAAAVGAVIGAIAGGRKGAAIGGATGGGAGTAGVLLTRGKEVELNKEQLFSFRIEEPFEVRVR